MRRGGREPCHVFQDMQGRREARCRHNPARQPCVSIAPRPGRMEQPSVTCRDAGTDSADGTAGRDSPGWFQTSRLETQGKGLGETLGKALWRHRQQVPGLAGGYWGCTPGDAPAGDAGSWMGGGWGAVAYPDVGHGRCLQLLASPVPSQTARAPRGKVLPRLGRIILPALGQANAPRSFCIRLWVVHP